MKEKMKPIRGKNSVEIDKIVCDARRVELGLTQVALAELCGRIGGWYNGLKDKKTTPQAARLLAKALQLDYEDILKCHSPKEEQIEAEIEGDALRADLSDENNADDKSHGEELKNALEANTEALKGMVSHAMCIASALERIADALESRNAETKLP